MQIFGRAGRPQYDTFGHGTIITTHDKLSHYLSLMTRQNPIESQFINSLTDNLNAEVFHLNLTLSQTSPCFSCLQYKSFVNTVRKGEIANYEQFLLFPQCFLPFWRTFCHFPQIQNCHLHSRRAWKGLKFVMGKGTNLYQTTNIWTWSNSKQV